MLAGALSVGGLPERLTSAPDGAEGVLVDLNTKKYYQLNETASLIWRRLEKGTSLSSIASEMTELFDVTLEQATLSVATAVRSFGAQKLLRVR